MFFKKRNEAVNQIVSQLKRNPNVAIKVPSYWVARGVDRKAIKKISGLSPGEWTETIDLGGPEVGSAIIYRKRKSR